MTNDGLTVIRGLFQIWLNDIITDEEYFAFHRFLKEMQSSEDDKVMLPDHLKPIMMKLQTTAAHGEPH